ncbi:hypothetical protein SVXHr_2722 [Halorhabdus sp. SVX81]|uniref:phospholipase D-like domain-containing protein n=1 Tax=Halorhabdus sp. SVX81 TaxID=2978283 RepID=UPI0023DB1C3C|nr:phospholipase D-like domain-containing protein [Halorhabdus sp. SVX81]WEL18865.1 hypothetical protein SVXHr_2722 [Halorhabdus sp. SVX81]
MLTDFPDVLEEHTTGQYWGITPESLLLYNNATVTQTDVAWEALHRYYDLTVYVTNHAVDWETYIDALEMVVSEWLDPQTRLLAQHATSATAQQFVLGASYEAAGGVMRILRMAQESLEDNHEGTTILLARRDVRAIAEDRDIKLLRTLGALRATTDGYEISRSAVKTLHGSRKFTESEACWAILARICETHGVTDLDTVVSPLLRWFDVTPPDSKPANIQGSLPVYAGDERVSAFVEKLFAEESMEVFTDIENESADRADRLEETIGLRQPKVPVETPTWPISDQAAAVCAVASQHQHPVAVEWLPKEKENRNKFELHRILRDAGFEVSLEENLLLFEKPYSGPTAPDAVAAYEDYIKIEQTRARSIAASSRQLANKLDTAWADQRTDLLASSVNRLEDVTIAPIEFVFSMFDPVFHADEYETEEYIGDSPHLADEVDRIREWRSNQPHDAVTFVEEVRKVCAYPLENESVAPKLRVMSPWLNFSITEYTALFQRLLENGVEIQLLFRLPSPDNWNKLKQNFLTRLGDTHDNLTLRTYTRYKKFKDHTQLRRHKRNETDSEGDSFVSETGVHAKLFIAGDPETGAVLAGSANLMENSFYYNPEAGLHTRHPEVIQTAIDYFDLIWDVAEPDEIDKSVFTGQTNFEFYPKVYRP